MTAPRRHRFVTLAGIAAASFIFFCACATAGKMVGKVTWFAVDAGLRVTGATVQGVASVAGIESRRAVNLTASAASRLLAEQEATKLAQLFWSAAQGGALETCYGLLSDDLKRKLPWERFMEEAGKWAGRIRLVRIDPVIVRPDRVEVPTELAAPAEDVTSTVRLVIIPFETTWKILSWTVK